MSQSVSRCGRLMIGSGTDVYDPTCDLPEGHLGSCRSFGAVDQHRLEPYCARREGRIPESGASMTLTQAQTLEWVRERWPDRTDLTWRALKLGEEAGEVQGTVGKMDEGRKTLADLATETAQLVICAMALAESAGFDLQAAITAEWERCRIRVWSAEAPSRGPSDA